MKALLAAVFFAAAPAAASVDVGIIGRAKQPGEALLVVVKGADPQHVPEGIFEGKPLRFFEGKKGAYLALVGIDLEIAPGPHPLSLSVAPAGGSPVPWSTSIDVSPKAFPTRELKVEDKYVKPPKEEEERAEREAKMLKEIFAHSDAYRYFTGTFEAPIPGAAVSRFGERSVFNGVPKAPHSGADLRAKAGVPIRAPEAGKVVVAENLFYQGNCVFLDHGYGLITGYFHMSRVDVQPGQVVKKGERLGLVGATGRVTGPHLHWSAKLGSARVDPFSLAHIDLTRWLPAPGK